MRMSFAYRKFYFLYCLEGSSYFNSLVFRIQETEVLSLKRRLHDLTRDDNNNEEEQSKRQQLRALEAYAEEATKEKGMLERHRNTLQVRPLLGGSQSL